LKLFEYISQAIHADLINEIIFFNRNYNIGVHIAVKFGDLIFPAVVS